MTPRRWAARGFTLIEILVAVLIVGIVLSVAVMSLTLAGDDREIQREARRLMSLIELAQDDAVLQGREFGLEFLTRGYRFVEFDPATGAWAEPLFDESLKTWQLPESVALSLYLEDQRVVLDEEPARMVTNAGGPQPDYAPHLLIFSSGDATPFELHLVGQRDSLRIAIRGDLLGNLEFVPDDDIEL